MRCYPPLWLSLDVGDSQGSLHRVLAGGWESQSLWSSVFSGSEGIYPLVVTATVDTLKACLAYPERGYPACYPPASP